MAAGQTNLPDALFLLQLALSSGVQTPKGGIAVLVTKTPNFVRTSFDFASLRYRLKTRAYACALRLVIPHILTPFLDLLICGIKNTNRHHIIAQKRAIVKGHATCGKYLFGQCQSTTHP